MPDKLPVRTREALQWATIGGARAIGLERKIGSLTPGKHADIVLLRASDTNLAPVHNPVYTIVEQAGDGNVDTVIIGGVTRKTSGKSTFPEAVRRQRLVELYQSAERIMASAGFEPTRD